jgi:hypothetical protein
MLKSHDQLIRIFIRQLLPFKRHEQLLDYEETVLLCISHGSGTAAETKEAVVYAMGNSCVYEGQLLGKTACCLFGMYNV